MALRDVQSAILLHAHAAAERTSAVAAVMMAADSIAVELRCLKDEQSDARARAFALENQDKNKEVICDANIVAPANRLFDLGYRNGLGRALALVTAHGRAMKDSSARQAMNIVIARMEHYLAEVANMQPGRVKTLRIRKFALPDVVAGFGDATH